LPLLVFAGAAVYVYLLTFRLPAVPIFVPLDEGLYTSAALRILQGEAPYRDFFVSMTPGIFYLVAGAFEVGGTKLATVGALDVLLGALLCVVTYAVARGFTSRAGSVLGALAVATLAFRFCPQTTHNWYSTLSGMLAVLALRSEDPPRTWRSPAAAGLLAGVAFVFTQHRGVLALLALAVILAVERGVARRDRGRALAALLGGFAVPCLVLLVVLVGQGALGPAVRDLVLFNATRYGRQHRWLPFVDALATEWGTILAGTAGARARGAVALVTNAFLVVAPPAVYAVALARILPSGAARDPRLCATTAFGIAMYLSAFSRASLELHAFVSPPALAVLAGLLDRPARFVSAAVTARRALAVWCVVLLIASVVRVQTRPMAIQSSRAGTFAAHEAHAGVAWIIERTSPGHHAFFFAQLPGYYLLTSTRNPGRLWGILDGGATPPADLDGVIANLERYRVPVGLWQERTPEQPEEARLADYLATRYSVDARFTTGATTVLALRRNP
jgi:hypothetical protein